MRFCPAGGKEEGQYLGVIIPCYSRRCWPPGLRVRLGAPVGGILLAYFP